MDHISALILNHKILFDDGNRAWIFQGLLTIGLLTLKSGDFADSTAF
jgi:hypothetical protein